MGGVLNGWVLLAAAALTAPAWYDALVEHSMAWQTALLRLVVAAVVTSVGAGLVRWLIDETSAPSRAVISEPLERGPDPPSPPPPLPRPPPSRPSS